MFRSRSDVTFALFALGLFSIGCSGAEVVERHDGSRFALGEPVDEAALRRYTIALELLRAGKSEEAELHLEEAHRLAPRSGRIAALLAHLLAARSPSAASTLLVRTLENTDEVSPVHTELAELALEGKNATGAIHHARLALLADPDSDRARSLLARALRETGLSEESSNVERVHRALTKEPNLEHFAASLHDADRLFRLDSKDDQALLVELVVEGNVARARTLTKGSMNDGELALTFLRYGRSELANELATARLGLDKNDPCALLAAAVAADYLGKDPLPPTSLMGKCSKGASFLDELVKRRLVGVPGFEPEPDESRSR